METSTIIDVNFDFRSDTPIKKDPDTSSLSLRRYHKILWSKPLPNGDFFELDDTTPGAYLHHQSALGEFFLASDAVIPTFRKEPRLFHILNAIPVDEREDFMRIGYTIGGMMIFPGNRINRKMTINGARGFHPRIKDRFDLTVECIRRHYSKERSPLSDPLDRYAEFFSLFSDFHGYVDFFLLQDLVNDDYTSVRFFMPFTDFNDRPVPSSAEAYRDYRDLAREFIELRNKRIRELF